MVKLKTAIASVTISQLIYDLLASTRNTSVLTGASELFNLADLVNQKYKSLEMEEQHG